VCLFRHSGVQNILCCVFVLFFFVLCILRCQFIWIFHCLFSLRYSLTFILTVNVPSGVVQGEQCSLLPKSQSYIFVFLTPLGTLTVRINVREYRRENKKWKIQINWQRRIHKTKKNKTNTQHNMFWTPLCRNKHTTQYVLDTTMPKQTHNTICFGHHYAETNAQHNLSEFSIFYFLFGIL
jgi:hypothetical protein